MSKTAWLILGIVAVWFWSRTSSTANATITGSAGVGSAGLVGSLFGSLNAPASSTTGTTGIGTVAQSSAPAASASNGGTTVNAGPITGIIKPATTGILRGLPLVGTPRIVQPMTGVGLL